MRFNGGVNNFRLIVDHFIKVSIELYYFTNSEFFFLERSNKFQRYTHGSVTCIDLRKTLNIIISIYAR